MKVEITHCAALPQDFDFAALTANVATPFEARFRQDRAFFYR